MKVEADIGIKQKRKQGVQVAQLKEYVPGRKKRVHVYLCASLVTYSTAAGTYSKHGVERSAYLFKVPGIVYF